MNAALITIGAIGLLVLIWAAATYNRMARLRQHIRESWSDIDVELRRRFYNGNVREMSQLCQTVPTNLIARAFSFEGGDYFELDSDAERVVPRVGTEGRQARRHEGRYGAFVPSCLRAFLWLASSLTDDYRSAMLPAGL